MFGLKTGDYPDRSDETAFLQSSIQTHFFKVVKEEVLLQTTLRPLPYSCGTITADEAGSIRNYSEAEKSHIFINREQTTYNQVVNKKNGYFYKLNQHEKDYS